MNNEFSYIINKFHVIYQDDATIFSKHHGDHFTHLRRVLEECWEFKISLNLKNSILGAMEHRIIEHIVSTDGDQNIS